MTENDHITSALLAVVIIIITRNQYAPPLEGNAIPAGHV